MFSLLWLLYLLLISAIVAFFTFALFFRKGNLQDSTHVKEKVKFIKKHVPPTTSKGWHLKTVDSGLRVWRKDLGSNTPSWVPGIIYACSGIIPASKREVINVLKQPGLLMEWDPLVKDVSKVTMATNQDVISISFNFVSFIARTVCQLRECFGGEINAIYSRYWDIDMKSNSQAWFMSSFIEQVIPAEGALWSCFLVSSIDNVDDEQTESLLTLVVAPVSQLFASIPQLTTCRVVGLQDYFTHYKCDQSPAKSFGSEASTTTLSSSVSDDHVKELRVPLVTTSDHDQADAQAKLTEYKEMTSNTMRTNECITSDSHIPNFLSSQSVENMIQKLNEVYEATEGTDNWTTVGNIKGVDILKRPARAGERPWDCFKGTSVVCVPMHYVLAYIYSLDYRGEWDDLFLKGEVVEQYDPITKVSRLEYKPVWPASGRDFCTLVLLRELAEGVYGVASEAVEHENCPEQRGLVRGEIIIGGFVVKELSSDPPSCLVTYITRADLKGNLPARLVNRLTASQPQAVAVLRDKLEALYQADVESNGKDMSQIKKEGVDLWVELMKAKEVRNPHREEVGEREEKESLQEWNLVETHCSGSLQSSTDMADKPEASNISDSGEMFPITDENMQLPLVDRHHIDFRALGSQAAANLLGEVLLASKVEISMSEEWSDLVAREQEWSYQSIEKDVVILRKINPGEKINSFLGKGMIKVKPPTVWQAIRNHMTRHVYDRMLKKTKLVRQIDDQTKLLYYHHETTQCFVKQSRDFVVLTAERVEPERYVIAGTSVEIPELPPTKEIIRGKIFSSGWIIEPVLQNGQLYSMVSYLSQVDFGGFVPARVLNLVARRQPLCIAYLRDHLEKMESSNKNNLGCKP